MFHMLHLYPSKRNWQVLIILELFPFELGAFMHCQLPLALHAEEVVLNRFLYQKGKFPELGGPSSRLFRGSSQKHQMQTPKRSQEQDEQMQKNGKKFQEFYTTA